MRIRSIFLLMFLFLLIPFVNASIIGVSPGIINFKSMVRNGYAEDSVVITTSTGSELLGHFELKGDIAEWVSFRPSSEIFNATSGLPYRFTIIMQPPGDTANGNYTGTLNIITDEIITVDEGAGSSIIAAVAVRIYVEVIDQEIVACRAGAFHITNTEIDDEFSVSALVYNDGNVRLRPTFKVDVYNRDQTKILFTKIYFGDQILPTTKKSIVKDIENTLDIGQYFANIFVQECLVSQWTTFDVFEKGGIVDKGEFIGIRANKFSQVNTPTPIEPIFKNTGPRKVVAKFKGQITDLDTNRIIGTLETDELVVEPGQEMRFPLYFTPKSEGEYLVSGRIVYNNKITFEEKSEVISVVSSSKAGNLTLIIMVFVYVIIGLIILILISKIKKKKRRKF